MFKRLSAAYTRCREFGRHFAGFRPTDAIEDLIPEDVALLGASSPVRARALADLEARRLIGNHYEDDFESEGGDFLLLIDCSGSMGRVWDMVQPLVAAIYLLGSANGKKVKVAYFDEGVHWVPNRTRDETVLEMLRTGLGGGTSIRNALTSARRSYPDADILMVTDAEDNLDAATVRRVLQGGKLTTLFIGNSDYGAAAVLRNTEGTEYREVPYINPDDPEMYDYMARALR